MKKILLFFLIFSGSIAYAQHSQTDMEHYLTNGEFRTWIYKNYKITLGSTCSGEGQSFDFYRKGNLVIRKRCVDGVPKIDSLKWTIVPVLNSPGEFYLKFNKDIVMHEGFAIRKMLLNFPNPAVMASKKGMLWNNPPDCKTCPDEIVNFESRN